MVAQEAYVTFEKQIAEISKNKAECEIQPQISSLGNWGHVGELTGIVNNVQESEGEASGGLKNRKYSLLVMKI